MCVCMCVWERESISVFAYMGGVGDSDQEMIVDI